MNIIFGDNVAELAREKYTVLELDSFLIEDRDQTATAYAIVEKIPLLEMTNLPHYQDLHENLMREYQKRNWKYCEDAIEYLTGKWGGEADTFYSELHQRIQNLKQTDLTEDWTGRLDKTVEVV
jgi:hypothetical protein